MKSLNAIFSQILQIIISLLLFTTLAYSREIYLNGVDISTLVNQKLKKVDIYINDNGAIMITAPHYRVHKETQLTPLSSILKAKEPNLKHKKLQALPAGESPKSSALQKPVETQMPTNSLPQTTKAQQDSQKQKDGI